MTAFRAQAKGVNGWVDGGLFVRKANAEADAQRLANLYGCEVRVIAEPQPKLEVRCSCAHHSDGSVTTMLCSLHADQDPCQRMAAVTGRRRTGSIVRGVCSACGWSALPSPLVMPAPSPA